MEKLGLHGQSSDPQNEAIGTKLRHLVVNTSQTLYERSIRNNHTPISLVKTGYRLLGHLPGLSRGQPQFRAPPDSPLGDRPTVEHDAMSTSCAKILQNNNMKILNTWVLIK
ncbi:hypothetical protein M9H77_30186 [Catharanthus roseus]|uniref:Uncharacterized protein n=1 Tax=Catharanthus roseus TaxID=4058 RepID=A0ACB9ZXD2_CATRO|nr:hypothetical protein M9H77_30186 [Catharanthus roseus]